MSSAEDIADEVADEMAKRSGSVMLMGILLGGAIIGALFLGYLFWSTNSAYQKLQPVAAKDHTDLALATDKLDRAKTRQDEYKKIVTDLNAKLNAALRNKGDRVLADPEPSSTDPFAPAPPPR